MQSITIDAELDSGSWALPRIIRRRAPWNVNRIVHPVETFFRSERDGTGVDIYILDTGILTTHDEFGGRVTLLDSSSDNNGHGTQMASMAAGSTVGIARGANIFSHRCLDSGLNSSESLIAAASAAVISHHAGRSNPAVCSMSFGTGNSAPFATPVGNMIDAGIVCVSIAQNGRVELGGGTNIYPGQTADVICVGGMGMADIPYFRDSFGTNYGSPVDIMAPGQAVLAATNTGDSDYTTPSGTSGACALVAGVVACMLEGHDKPTTRTEVQSINAALLANATTGRFRDAFGLTPLPDKILYMDPDQTAPEPIPGL